MNTLRLFLDVARCHSFSQAAALHGITQSAASQRISQLEKRLGVTLLDRSVRPLALTESGRAFYAGCEDVVQRYDQLEQQVAAMAQAEGPVRVAAIYSAGIELLHQLRRRFQAEHPDTEVQIHYEKPHAVYESVREQACDLGILSYPERWGDVGIIPLRDERMAVVCHPSHPLAEREAVNAAELSPYEMAAFEPELPVGRRLETYLRRHGGRPTVADRFDNIDTIKSVVSVTERFSILPVRTVRREVQRGTLATVTLSPDLVRPLGIIYHRGGVEPGGFSAATQRFVDYLLANAGPSVEVVGQTPTEPSSDDSLVGANE